MLEEIESYLKCTDENINEILEGKDLSRGLLVFVNEGQDNEKILGEIKNATGLSDQEKVKDLNSCKFYYIKQRWGDIMLDEIDIKDYEKEIIEGKFEDIYKDLVDKTIDVVEELGKKKGYKIPKDKSEIELFNSIQLYFKENFIDSLNVYYLMKSLIEWNYDEEDNPYDKRINNIIIRYNDLVDKLKMYEKIESEINEKGFDAVTKKREEKYEKQFKEKVEHSMYYEDSWDIVKLMRKVILDNEKNFKKANDVEKIMLIDNAYNYIMKIGYKKVAYIYSDEYKQIQSYLKKSSSFLD